MMLAIPALILAVFIVVLITTPAKGKSPGECHKCGVQVNPPALHCQNCYPKPRSPVNGPKIPPMNKQR